MINTQEFVSLIQQKQKDKEAFSFVRYGDGESIILDTNSEKKEFVLKRQLGYIPSEEEKIKIENNLVESYIKCDLIGLPEGKHLQREDDWSHSIDVLSKKVTIGLLKVTSIDICYDLLYEDKFKDILQDQETVNYISCRNIDVELKRKYNIKRVNSFIIAPEQKFTSGYTGAKHYPTQFNLIHQWVKSIPCKGNICLVGAGVIGKIYNIWFKEQGGISLDLGGVFDLWAGKCTRGPNRGLDVEDNTYKL